MLIDDIKKKLIEARKNKAPETDFLSLIYSESVLIGKNAGNRETTNSEVISYLTKTKKNSLLTLDMAVKNNREEVANNIKLEIAILEEFLPKQLSEEKLRYIIQAMINDGLSSLGLIMKVLKANYAGQYNGKVASNIIKELLK